ncbi:MAG: hypothetical protein AAF633_06575 [Chloroflexota bacterium]
MTLQNMMARLGTAPEIMPEATNDDNPKRSRRRSRVTSSQNEGESVGVRYSRRIREQIKQLLKLSEAQTALSWAIVFVLTVTIATLYVNQASRTAETGRYVQELRFELQTLKRENGVIEQSIAGAQSLDILQSRANGMGFVLADPGDRLYVSVDEYPVDIDTNLFVQPSPTPEIVVIESMEEALLQSFTNRILRFTSGSAEN